jgi:hypothetical protein
MQAGMKSDRSLTLKCAKGGGKNKIMSVSFQIGVPFYGPRKMQFGQWQHPHVVNNTTPALIFNFQHKVYEKHITNSMEKRPS